MTTATAKRHINGSSTTQRKSSITKPLKTLSAYSIKLRPTMRMRPLKAMNKGLVRYVHNKPYRTLGIATLLTGVVIGFLYSKFKL